MLTYSLNTTSGALTEIATQGIDGNQGEALAIASGSKAVVFTPKFAYVTNSTDKTISEYTINDSTGALAAVAEFIRFPTQTVPLPSPLLLPVLSFTPPTPTTPVWEYAVNATTGALTKISGSPITGFGRVSTLVVDPTGQASF